MSSSQPRRLVVEAVSHQFGDLTAVDEVSVAVEPAEVVCLLGPSGSGKSTLLRLIAGLERLRRGRISIDGLEVASADHHEPPERRSVGFVFQDYALFPHLDVRRNVAFGMSGERTAAAADELIAQVGMSGFEGAMPHTLSGGQQQRVALARALAPEPRVMLLDEPFSGLDARLREDVRATTLSVLRERGVATLMVSHDPAEALATADRIGVMREGRLVQTGSPDEVYNRAASREVAETFGPVNVLAGEVQNGRVTTPLGDVAVPDSSMSGRVEILVRPEGVRIVDGGSDVAATARIVASIREGSTTRLTLELGDGTRIEMRELSTRMRSLGAEVQVCVRPELCILARQVTLHSSSG